VAGVPGEPFLKIFVNEIGAGQDLRFQKGAFEMPVGTIPA
jgi:hypothetical protein